MTVRGRALVARQAGAGGVGPLGLARREGAAWVGLAGVLHLAVHRAVTVLHLLVPLLTPAPGLVICHLTLRVGVRAGDILAGVTAFITEKYLIETLSSWTEIR